MLITKEKIPLSRDGQIATCGRNLARHSVFSDPWKHSGNMFKSEIYSNLSL